jgi:hypothetical protein
MSGIELGPEGCQLPLVIILADREIVIGASLWLLAGGAWMREVVGCTNQKRRTVTYTLYRNRLP